MAAQGFSHMLLWAAAKAAARLEAQHNFFNIRLLPGTLPAWLFLIPCLEI